MNPHNTRILTSCNGSFILPTLTLHNPSLAVLLSTSIAAFSTTPHPNNKTAPAITVELTTGFRLVGHLVGSSNFTSKYFDCRIADVKEILLHNSTTSPTNNHAATSFISASSKNYLTSSLKMFSSTYQPNTQTLLVKIRMAH